MEEQSTHGSLLMPVDIAETPEEFVIMAELPGMDPDDIEITLTDNQLTIKGGSVLPNTKTNARTTCAQRDASEASAGASHCLHLLLKTKCQLITRTGSSRCICRNRKAPSQNRSRFVMSNRAEL